MLYGEDPISGAMHGRSRACRRWGRKPLLITDPSGDGSVLKGVKFDPPDADPYLNRQARDRSVSPQSKMFTPAQELDGVDAYISRGEKIQAALKRRAIHRSMSFRRQGKGLRPVNGSRRTAGLEWRRFRRCETKLPVWRTSTGHGRVREQGVRRPGVDGDWRFTDAKARRKRQALSH